MIRGRYFRINRPSVSPLGAELGQQAGIRKGIFRIQSQKPQINQIVAGFFNHTNIGQAVKILQNKLLIQHPIITVINAENEKYDDILSKKVCMHSFGSMLFKDCLNPEVYPDGKTLINVVINVDCIHQGNAETRKTRNEVEQIISLEVMKFLVWSLLLQLLKPISIVARHAFYILKLLNAQNLTLPPRSISNAERKFFEYIEALKKADEYILEKSLYGEVEYDTEVDNYLRSVLK